MSEFLGVSFFLLCALEFMEVSARLFVLLEVPKVVWVSVRGGDGGGSGWKSGPWEGISLCQKCNNFFNSVWECFPPDDNIYFYFIYCVTFALELLAKES